MTEILIIIITLIVFCVLYYVIHLKFEGDEETIETDVELNEKDLKDLENYRLEIIDDIIKTIATNLTYSSNNFEANIKYSRPYIDKDILLISAYLRFDTKAEIHIDWEKGKIKIALIYLPEYKSYIKKLKIKRDLLTINKLKRFIRHVDNKLSNNYFKMINEDKDINKDLESLDLSLELVNTSSERKTSEEYLSEILSSLTKYIYTHDIDPKLYEFYLNFILYLFTEDQREYFIANIPQELLKGKYLDEQNNIRQTILEIQKSLELEKEKTEDENE